ncbi:MAG TPA: PAS-domain containing protein [Azospirillum sp.]|nr:PAS-domain containing protein [Azospirillum sp.]
MAGAGLARFDAEGRLAGMNRAFAECLGGDGRAPTLAEMLAVRMAEGGVADPLGRGAAALVARLEAGEMAALRCREGRWLGLTMVAEDGGCIVTAADLSAAVAEQRLLGGRELGEKQALLETTFDAMVDAVAGFDLDLRLVVCNRLYGEMFRLPAELMRTGTAFDAIVRFMAERGDYGTVDVPSFVAGRVAVARRTDTFDFRFTLSDGKVFDARHSPLPGGGFLRRYSDITEAARVEEAQRSILEAIAFPLVVTRMADGIVVAANEPAGYLFGAPLHEVIGRASARSFYNDPEARARMIERLREQGGRIDNFEARMRASDGRTFWALLSVRTFRFHGMDAILTCINDISERKRIELELAASRELFEQAIRAARDGISQWDLQTGELWFSPQWWALLGYGEDEMVNTLERWNELVLEDDRAESLRMAEDFAAGRRDDCQILQRFRHKDGRIVHLYTRAIKMTDADGATVKLIGSHTDVTERIRAEEEVRAAKEEAERALKELKEAQAHLVQSEKMAALGSLVAGVAHEINTPIGIALTGASLLAERTGVIRRSFEVGKLRKPDFADYIDTAAEATQLMMLNVDRAAQLIQSFKQIAVDQASEERRVFDMRDYIHEVLRSLGVRLKKAAHTVEVRCPDDLVLDSYPGALSQVLTNFVMNSIMHGYAPGQAGRLTVVVARLSPDEVELRYSDDGRGIPPALHGRVFEPFFTTSRGTGGSGLGLNIVYNIVTRTLKGRITLDSAPGRGTTFTLRFPRVAPDDRSGEGAAG